MPRISTLNASYPTDCETLLQLRHTHADYRYDLNRGYIAYQISFPTRAYEHRLVAELSFGGIPEGYHVHHINEVITDNRVSNLQILSPSEHTKRHNPPLGQTLTCPVCDAPFWASPAMQIKRNRTYCSLECAAMSQRIVDRPSREELFALLSTLPNFVAAGNLYGVSDNAVRKWCKYYDLPVKTTDWKRGD